MLVLFRKVRQSILIGDDIVVEVVSLPGGGVRLGITAPSYVTVLRDELAEKVGVSVTSKKREISKKSRNAPL